MPKTEQPRITYVRLRSTEVRRLPRWLCVVQAVIAYEWLISGLDKLLNHDFAARLPVVIQHQVQVSPFTWYVTWFDHNVIPHIPQYAQAVAWSETGIGALLVIGALTWIARPDSSITVLASFLACLALLAATILSANFYLLAGSGLPWVDPVQAFSDGVRLDALLPLICVALLGGNANALRGRADAHTQAAAATVFRGLAA